MRRMHGLLPGVVFTADGPDLLGVAGLDEGDFQIGFTQGQLEANPDAFPPTLTHPVFRGLHSALRDGTECLPLVIEAGAQGPFRVTRAAWLEPEGGRIEINSYQHLESLVAHWNGTPAPEPLVIETAKAMKQQALSAALASSNSTESTRNRMLASQVASARHRLLLELARYLACLDQGVGDLNGILYQQMTRDTVSQDKLSRCFQRLGNTYPIWPASVRWDAETLAAELPPNRKQARLIGSELEAAQADPRWASASFG